MLFNGRFTALPFDPIDSGRILQHRRTTIKDIEAILSSLNANFSANFLLEESEQERRARCIAISREGINYLPLVESKAGEAAETAFDKWLKLDVISTTSTYTER